MNEDELDQSIILPEEIEMADDSEDEVYLFNFDPTMAKEEREEINRDIWELKSQGLW